MGEGDGLIPRRAAWACVATVVGLLLLFSFKTPGMGVTQAANGATGDQAIVGDVGPSATPASTGPQATSGATGSAGPTIPTATSGTTGSGGSAAGGSTASAAYQDGTYTGDTITTRYGDVQVTVTIAGGAITDVTAVSLPDGDGHSSRISSQAAPLLRDEALTAQSAQIDLLSGATYTSDGYERSLQSALDQAAG